MRIDKTDHQYQVTESNSSISTEQNNLAQTPDSQEPSIDSLETHDGSDVFFGADDIFHLQSTKESELKATAENFPSGDAGYPTKDGFKLQDALQTYSRELSVDPPQQFTDAISDLQKNVDGALNGDASSLENVLSTFGSVTDKPDLSNAILSTQGTETVNESGIAGASDSKYSEWKDDFEWEGPEHELDEPDDPDIPEEPETPPDDAPQTGNEEPTFIAAGSGSADGGASPQPADGGTNPDGGGKPDAGGAPDAGTPDDASALSGNDEDDDLEDLEIERYVDPDAIYSMPSGDLTESGKRTLNGGGITDGVRPDMDQSAPQMSPEQLPGFGVIDTTPEVDDYTALGSGELRTFGPGGDIVNPDMQNEATAPNPDTHGTDPYSDHIPGGQE
jgi:hypothetical protein